MTAFVVCVVLLLAALAVAVLFSEDLMAWLQRRREGAVARTTERKHESVEQEFRRARAAMNEAAGRSWRNLVDGDQ